MTKLTQSYRNLVRVVTLIYCVYMLFFAEVYQFMALNVLLAYIPLEISFHFKRSKDFVFCLLGLLWLVFYPNAPYLFTDFFHLEGLAIYQGMNQLFGQAVSDWLAFCLLTLGICVYGFLGMASIFTFIQEGHQRSFFNKRWQVILLILGINLLSSLAIFVGRFDRLHSIHLFTKPIETFKTIFLNWSMDKLIFILLFTGLQTILLGTIAALKSEKSFAKK